MKVLYTQCTLSQPGPNGKKITHGWIEKRAAKEGVHVELKGEDGLWLVEQVGDKWLEGHEIHDQQTRNRDALPSLNE